MKLYELTGRYLELEELASTGEWAEDSAAVLDQMLASIEGDIEQKLLGIARIRSNLKAEADAIKAEEERLARRRKSAENARERLERYTFEQMETVGIERVQDEAFTVAVQNNPPSIDILDEAKIEARWWIPQPAKLDRAGLKRAIQDGAEIDGAQVVQARSVRFK